MLLSMRRESLIRVLPDYPIIYKHGEVTIARFAYDQQICKLLPVCGFLMKPLDGRTEGFR